MTNKIGNFEHGFIPHEEAEKENASLKARVSQLEEALKLIHDMSNSNAVKGTCESALSPTPSSEALKQEGLA